VLAEYLIAGIQTLPCSTSNESKIVAPRNNPASFGTADIVPATNNAQLADVHAKRSGRRFTAKIWEKVLCS